MAVAPIPIVLVEDDPLQRENIKRVLAAKIPNADITAIASEDALRARAKEWRDDPENRPALIILDQILKSSDPPTAGGRRCLKILRGHEATSDLKVLLHSVDKQRSNKRDSNTIFVPKRIADAGADSLALSARSVLIGDGHEIEEKAPEPGRRLSKETIATLSAAFAASVVIIRTLDWVNTAVAIALVIASALLAAVLGFQAKILKEHPGKARRLIGVFAATLFAVVAMAGVAEWRSRPAMDESTASPMGEPSPFTVPDTDPIVAPIIRGGCASLDAAPPAITEGALEVAFGVANVSCGDARYHGSVTTIVDDVVEVRLWLGYYGEETELGEIAVNLSATNGDTISAEVVVGEEIATVNAQVELSVENARLEFLPGSIEMRHNAAPLGGAQQWTTESLPDRVFSGPGDTIGRLRRGELGEISIVARFRSVFSGVSIRVEAAAATAPSEWATTIAARPGESLLLRAIVGNEGNQPLNDVRLMFDVPDGLTYVDDSVVTSSGGSFVSLGDNGISSFGLDIGDLEVGADRSVVVALDVAADAAGSLRPMAFVDPLGMARFFNLATLEVSDTGATIGDTAVLEMDLEVANPDRDTEWSSTTTVSPGETMRVKLYVHNLELGTSERSDGSSFITRNLSAELQLADTASRSFAPVAVVDGPDATRVEDHATITVEGAIEVELRGVPGSVAVRRCSPETGECFDFPADDTFLTGGALQLGALPALNDRTGAEVWVTATFAAQTVDG